MKYFDYINASTPKFPWCYKCHNVPCSCGNPNVDQFPFVSIFPTIPYTPYSDPPGGGRRNDLSIDEHSRR